MKINIKMISAVLVTSLAVTTYANEPRLSDLEDGRSYNKIGVTNTPATLPSFEPRIRDFEPKDPTVIRRPLQNNSVSFSFPITNKLAMDFTDKPAHSQSRQYRMEVTGKELRQGVNLTTTAPGALIRISGFNTNVPVEPQNLNLVIAKQKFAKGTAFDTLVDSRMMSKTGVGFQKGTTGFKISEQVGKGNFKLQTEQHLSDTDRYMINVFEKNSDVELHLTANKSSYVKGAAMSINAAVWFDGKQYPLGSAKSLLISPSGKKLPVALNKSGQMQLPMNMKASSIPGALWTLETEVDAMVDGQSVKRVGKVAFAYGNNSASLTKMQPMILQRAGAVSTMVPVRANKQSRYEVRAVLYATNSMGKLVPAMVTHSASDLSPGIGMIDMQFDAKILSSTGLNAPFELRNLQLRDQKQMTLLESI